MKATDDLRDEHKDVLHMLAILEGLGARMAAGQGPPAGDLGQVVEFLRVFVDRCHHGKEERLLFPALREAADAEAGRLIDRLLAEHEEGRGHVAVMARAAGYAPNAGGASGAAATESVAQAAPACRPGEEAEYAISGYAALLRPHIADEQKRLFPLADRVLPDDVQRRLAEGYERLEREVVGAGRHEAFHTMLHDLKERYAAPV